MNLTDDAGAVSATYDQDAFGNVLAGNAVGFHLTTKDYNSTIGLYYFYQRWYDPEVGRFFQRDRKFYFNLYAYCNSNPTNAIDPDGLKIVMEYEHSSCLYRLRYKMDLGYHESYPVYPTFSSHEECVNWCMDQMGFTNTSPATIIVVLGGYSAGLLSLKCAFMTTGVAAAVATTTAYLAAGLTSYYTGVWIGCNTWCYLLRLNEEELPYITPCG